MTKEKPPKHSLQAYLEKQPTAVLHRLLREQLDQKTICAETTRIIWNILEQRYQQNP